MFEVKQGTECQLVRRGTEWFSENFRMHVTQNDNIFDKHQVVVDPVGKLGANRSHKNLVGGAWAAAGYYGFEAAGWILMVHASNVTYLD
jgi:hypothetical protein